MLTISEVMKPKWHEIEGARFHLKSLSELGKLSLVESGRSEKTGVTFNKFNITEALSECLIGWDDIVDEQGKSLPFTVNFALTYLPMNVLSSLMAIIFNNAFIEDSVEKK